MNEKCPRRRHPSLRRRAICTPLFNVQQQRRLRPRSDRQRPLLRRAMRRVPLLQRLLPALRKRRAAQHLHFDSLSTSPTLLPSRGLVTLPRSPRSGVLFTLSSSSASSYPAILARSYDGQTVGIDAARCAQTGWHAGYGLLAARMHTSSSPIMITSRQRSVCSIVRAQRRPLSSGQPRGCYCRLPLARHAPSSTTLPTASPLHAANTTEAVLSGWIREQMDNPANTSSCALA